MVLNNKIEKGHNGMIEQHQPYDSALKSLLGNEVAEILPNLLHKKCKTKWQLPCLTATPSVGLIGSVPQGIALLSVINMLVFLQGTFFVGINGHEIGKAGDLEDFYIMVAQATS